MNVNYAKVHCQSSNIHVTIKIKIFKKTSFLGSLHEFVLLESFIDNTH